MKTFWKADSLTESQIGGYPLKKLFITTLILNLVVGALSLLIQPLLPPQIPIYYGMAEAEHIIAAPWTLVLPSLCSLGILGVNFFLGLAVEDEFIKKTLVLSSLTASFFATIATFKIALLVGSI
jgi:uncharacterized membrane protein